GSRGSRWPAPPRSPCAFARAARRPCRSACGRGRRRTPARRAESPPEGSAARGLRDVRGDVGDLLGRELTAEGRHRTLAVRHPVDHEGGGGFRVIEVRPDGAGRVCVRERVAALATGGLEYLLAGDRI